MSTMNSIPRLSRGMQLWHSSERFSKDSFSKSYSKIDENAVPRKMLKLTNLKNCGTTIKNNDGQYEYYYDPIEIGSNPYTNICEDKENGYSIELAIDESSKKVFLPDLVTRREDLTYVSHTSPIFESSCTSVIPSTRCPLYENCSSGVYVCGTMRIRVHNTARPLVMKSNKLYLKCFVGEYACFVDSQRKVWKRKLNVKTKYCEKIVKTLAHPKDKSLDSHLLPCKILEIDLCRNSKAQYLTTGLYEYPFTFTINFNEFPSSCYTYFGSTAYRVESRTQFLNAKKKNDTILLTDQIDVKRVLPNANCMVKYDSVNIEGSWNQNELFYNISLATKMIEIGQPFSLTIGIMKAARSQITIEKTSISLMQTVSIPCINTDTQELMATSYAKKSIHQIYHCEFPESEQKIQDKFQQYYEIDNLLIPTNGNLAQVPWLKPYYCELSSQLTKRARLKITHTLNVQMTFNNCLTSDHSCTYKPPTNLIFKIPILLVDSDMVGNMSLPLYDECDANAPPEYSLA